MPMCRIITELCNTWQNLAKRIPTENAFDLDFGFQGKVGGYTIFEHCHC